VQADSDQSSKPAASNVSTANCEASSAADVNGVTVGVSTGSGSGRKNGMGVISDLADNVRQSERHCAAETSKTAISRKSGTEHSKGNDRSRCDSRQDTSKQAPSAMQRQTSDPTAAESASTLYDDAMIIEIDDDMITAATAVEIGAIFDSDSKQCADVEHSQVQIRVREAEVETDEEIAGAKCAAPDCAEAADSNSAGAADQFLCEMKDN
jgi:hypothetical protein